MDGLGRGHPRAAAGRDRAVEEASTRRPIRSREFAQYLFFTQWRAVKEACRARGIRVMGDIPIFVAHDSADVWAHPELFQLRADGRPEFVAGVPPDYFSATGQLWGNPLYRWDRMEASGFAWWIDALPRDAGHRRPRAASTTSAASRPSGRCPATRRPPSTASG